MLPSQKEVDFFVYLDSHNITLKLKDFICYFGPYLVPHIICKLFEFDQSNKPFYPRFIQDLRVQLLHLKHFHILDYLAFDRLKYS